MTRLTQYVERRHEIAQCYDELLADLPLTRPWQHPDSYSAYHLYVIRLQLYKVSKTHLQVFEDLRPKESWLTCTTSRCITQPYYRRMGFKQGDYPEAKQYYREVISIPMHPTLTDAEQDQVVNALREALEA